MRKLACLGAVVLLTIASSSMGAIWWDGGAGTTSWNDAQNWSNNVVPTAATVDLGYNDATSPLGTPANPISIIADNFTFNPGLSANIGLNIARYQGDNYVLTLQNGSTFNTTGYVLIGGQSVNTNNPGQTTLGHGKAVVNGCTWNSSGSFYVVDSYATCGFGELSLTDGATLNMITASSGSGALGLRFGYGNNAPLNGVVPTAVVSIAGDSHVVLQKNGTTGTSYLNLGGKASGTYLKSATLLLGDSTGQGSIVQSGAGSGLWEFDMGMNDSTGSTLVLKGYGEISVDGIGNMSSYYIKAKIIADRNGATNDQVLDFGGSGAMNIANPTLSDKFGFFANTHTALVLPVVHTTTTAGANKDVSLMSNKTTNTGMINSGKLTITNLATVGTLQTFIFAKDFFSASDHLGNTVSLPSIGLAASDAIAVFRIDQGGGMSFDTAKLSLHWDPDAIPGTAGKTEADLQVFLYSGGAWSTLTVENRDTTNKIIRTAAISSASFGTSSAPTYFAMGFTQPTVAPALTVTVGEITANGAVLTWDTDAVQDEQVLYGLNTGYALSTVKDNFAKKNHTVQVSGLTPNTTYYYKAKSGTAEATGSFTTEALPSVPTTSIKAGGLLTYAEPMLGDQIIANGGFESDLTGWSTGGFSVDATVAHAGSKSAHIHDAYTILYANSVTQTFNISAGKAYRFSAWMKTDTLYDPNHIGDANFLCGARISFMDSSPVIRGTNDWMFLERSFQIFDTAKTGVKASLNCYGEPSGDVWFDDVELREELQPFVNVFVKYPNYRGMLFSDWSQTIKVDLMCTSPSGPLTDYHVDYYIKDESSGSTVISNTNVTAPSTWTEVTIDGSSLTADHTYVMYFRLVKTSSGLVMYEYPSYRLSKLAGTNRAGMRFCIDPDNRYRHFDKPFFMRGIYDSGGAALSNETDTYFSTTRRLWECQGNMFINYWWGTATTTAMNCTNNVLQRHGYINYATGNCGLNDAFAMDDFLINNNDSYVGAIAPHPAYGGAYLLDEASTFLAPQAFPYGRRLKALDPDGLNIGVCLANVSASGWSEVTDTLSTDPYTIWGTSPINWNIVVDWTNVVQNGVHHARPVYTVLQFGAFWTGGRFPTLAELNKQSYCAIAEGVNGIWYWSIGNGYGALAGIYGTGWTDANKVAHYQDLKDCVANLAWLDEALTAVDSNAKLSSNNTNIHTRVKFVNGVGYIFAYNYDSTNPQTVQFTWDTTGRHVDQFNGFSSGTLQADTLVGDNVQVFNVTFAASEAKVLILAPNDAAPIITQQPSSQSASPGKTLTFSVAAVGDGALSYQWRLNGGNIAGATSATYTTPSLALTDNGNSYTCAVTSSYGTTVSSAATASVSWVLNPDFELDNGGKPREWALGNADWWSVNSAEHYAGSKCLQLSGAEANPSGTTCTSNTFRLEPGTYNASFQIKTNGQFGQASPAKGIRMEIKTAAGVVVKDTGVIQGNFATWTLKQLTGTFTVAAAGDYIVNFLAYSGPSGTCWADSVTITKQ